MHILYIIDGCPYTYQEFSVSKQIETRNGAFYDEMDHVSTTACRNVILLLSNFISKSTIYLEWDLPLLCKVEQDLSNPLPSRLATSVCPCCPLGGQACLGAQELDVVSHNTQDLPLQLIQCTQRTISSYRLIIISSYHYID